MPRQLRVQNKNQFFHIIVRGNAKRAVFDAAPSYHEYLALLEKYAKRFRVAIFHYVLMPNHVHLLVQTLADNTLGKFMQGVTLSHTIRLHKRNNTCGHVWQGRYKSLLITRDSHFLQCGQYIELNPVRAGIVSHPSEYPWSSYCAYADGRFDPLIEKDPFFFDLGYSKETREQRYQDLINSALRLGPDPA